MASLRPRWMRASWPRRARVPRPLRRGTRSVRAARAGRWRSAWRHRWCSPSASPGNCVRSHDTHVEYPKRRARSRRSPRPVRWPAGERRSRRPTTPWRCAATTPRRPEDARRRRPATAKACRPRQQPKPPAPQRLVEPQQAPAEPRGRLRRAFADGCTGSTTVARGRAIAHASATAAASRRQRHRWRSRHPRRKQPTIAAADGQRGARAAQSGARRRRDGAARRRPDRHRQAARSNPGRARTANEADAADARALDRIEVTGSRVERFGDQPLDDEPPASADSPQVQHAWLQRVRQLVAERRSTPRATACASSQRRYPNEPLPDDLRALLDK